MPKVKICFLVGSMAISGGTYVIVQHAAFLSGMGYDVTLAVQEPFTKKTMAWHDQIITLRCVPFDSAKAERFDLVIATWWKTALELGNFNSNRFGYFVQSIESKFYSTRETPLRSLVDSTYNLPIIFATEATWIKEYLHQNHGQSASLIINGIRKDIYQISGECISQKNPGTPRVLIEGPFGVPFKNTALAIRLAKKAGVKDIWVLTSSPVNNLPGVSRVFSRVPMYETPKIYRSCDILVKLSTVEGMFGPPLEMFHCGGTAIVFDVSGHDEYIANETNALVIKSGDINAVVSAIRSLLNNKELLTDLTAESLKTAKCWPSWDNSSAKFAEWVSLCMESKINDRRVLAEINRESWRKYELSENDRLAKNPSVVRSYKLRALASRLLHPSITQMVKGLESKYEIIFGKDVVY